MSNNMFCFQCEQTAGGKACTVLGVCGKKPETANLQDLLISHLIKIAELCEGNAPTSATTRFMIEGLFTTITNVSFNNETLQELINKAEVIEKNLADTYSLNLENYPLFEMKNLWEDNEDIRSLKSLILFGVKGIAAYAFHALMLNYTDQQVDDFFFESLRAVGSNQSMDTLLPLVLKTGEVNYKCMGMLDKANITTYGAPVPTQVTMNIEKGPFIVVSGHDLKDLHDLLEQSKDKGVNIYTHGEMLPCHAYPKLKEYSHLKGNFGTAWQNQQKEFDNIPGSVLFTTNCIMPVKESYNDRIFTTEVVSYPGMVHVDDNKDFSPVIQKALELGGYTEDRLMTGINGGSTLTTGFGHTTVLGAADTIVEAVKTGAISKFILVGGCDGAKPGRNYYTDIVQKSPSDSIILTLACGKYRFNDLDLGTIGGLPRILDMGQCNDSFSAVEVAVALSNVFNCSVNELPLSIVLSWYEQKAVCVLLSLLYLGVKNIRIGPSLPAFVSPTVLNYLVENYNLMPISNADNDLAEIMGK